MENRENQNQLRMNNSTNSMKLAIVAPLDEKRSCFTIDEEQQNVQTAQVSTFVADSLENRGRNSTRAKSARKGSAPRKRPAPTSEPSAAATSSSSTTQSVSSSDRSLGTSSDTSVIKKPYSEGAKNLFRNCPVGAGFREFLECSDDKTIRDFFGKMKDQLKGRSFRLKDNAYVRHLQAARVIYNTMSFDYRKRFEQKARDSAFRNFMEQGQNQVPLFGEMVCPTKTEEGENGFRMPVSEIKFRDAATRDAEKRFHALEKNTILCSKCPTSSQPFEAPLKYMNHLTTHHEMLHLFACHCCGTCFPTRSALLAHGCEKFNEETNHLLDEKRGSMGFCLQLLACASCGKTAALRSRLIGTASTKQWTNLVELHKCHNPSALTPIQVYSRQAIPLRIKLKLRVVPSFLQGLHISCASCNVDQFESYEALKEHAQLYHANEGEKCPHPGCQERFCDESLLRHHLVSQHFPSSLMLADYLTNSATLRKTSDGVAQLGVSAKQSTMIGGSVEECEPAGTSMVGMSESVTVEKERMRRALGFEDAQDSPESWTNNEISKKLTAKLRERHPSIDFDTYKVVGHFYTAETLAEEDPEVSARLNKIPFDVDSVKWIERNDEPTPGSKLTSSLMQNLAVEAEIDTTLLQQENIPQGLIEPVFMCRRCSCLCEGERATIMHLATCSLDMVNGHTAAVDLSDENLVQCLLPADSLPNSSLVCPHLNCAESCCGIAGLQGHLAAAHGVITQHAPSQRDPNEVRLSASEKISRQINEFCGLTPGGELPLLTEEREKKRREETAVAMPQPVPKKDDVVMVGSATMESRKRKFTEPEGSPTSVQDRKRSAVAELWAESSRSQSTVVATAMWAESSRSRDTPPEEEMEVENEVVTEQPSTPAVVNGQEAAAVQEPSNQCEFCGLFLRSSRDLRKHLKEHPESESICFMCEASKRVSFNSVAELKEHMIAQHMQRRSGETGECCFCAKRMATAEIVRHLVHDCYMSPCGLCDATFRKANERKKHQTRNHKSVFNRFACVCKLSYPNYPAFNAHQCAERPAYKCTICKQVFERKDLRAASQHVRDAHIVKDHCMQCNRKVKENHEPGHLQEGNVVSTKTLRISDECDVKMFVNIDTLNEETTQLKDAIALFILNADANTDSGSNITAVEEDEDMDVVEILGSGSSVAPPSTSAKPTAPAADECGPSTIEVENMPPPASVICIGAPRHADSPVPAADLMPPPSVQIIEQPERTMVSPVPAVDLMPPPSVQILEPVESAKETATAETVESTVSPVPPTELLPPPSEVIIEPTTTSREKENTPARTVDATVSPVPASELLPPPSVLIIEPTTTSREKENTPTRTVEAAISPVPVSELLPPPSVQIIEPTPTSREKENMPIDSVEATISPVPTSELLPPPSVQIIESTAASNEKENTLDKTGETVSPVPASELAPPPSVQVIEPTSAEREKETTPAETVEAAEGTADRVTNSSAGEPAEKENVLEDGELESEETQQISQPDSVMIVEDVAERDVLNEMVYEPIDSPDSTKDDGNGDEQRMETAAEEPMGSDPDVVPDSQPVAGPSSVGELPADLAPFQDEMTSQGQETAARPIEEEKGEVDQPATSNSLSQDDDVILLPEQSATLARIRVKGPSSPGPGPSTDQSQTVWNPEGEDEDIMVGEPAPGAKGGRSGREKTLKCPSCSEMFCTDKSRMEHVARQHQFDVSTAENITTEDFGIPKKQMVSVCRNCSYAFEDHEMFRKHAAEHVNKNCPPIGCGMCSGIQLSKDNQRDHLAHHSAEREEDRIKYTCIHCRPTLTFYSESQIMIHLMKCHQAVIFFFCKRCLLGGLNGKTVWHHIAGGECAGNRRQPVNIGTMGMTLASELMFQPKNVKAHKEALRNRPDDFVLPTLCSHRSFIRFGKHFTACCEDTGGRCYGLTNVMRWSSVTNPLPPDVKMGRGAEDMFDFLKAEVARAAQSTSGATGQGYNQAQASVSSSSSATNVQGRPSSELLNALMRPAQPPVPNDRACCLICAAPRTSLQSLVQCPVGLIENIVNTLLSMPKLRPREPDLRIVFRFKLFRVRRDNSNTFFVCRTHYRPSDVNFSGVLVANARLTYVNEDAVLADIDRQIRQIQQQQQLAAQGLAGMQPQIQAAREAAARAAQQVHAVQPHVAQPHVAPPQLAPPAVPAHLGPPASTSSRAIPSTPRSPVAMCCLCQGPEVNVNFLIKLPQPTRRGPWLTALLHGAPRERVESCRRMLCMDTEVYICLRHVNPHAVVIENDKFIVLHDGSPAVEGLFLDYYRVAQPLLRYTTNYVAVVRSYMQKSKDVSLTFPDARKFVDQLKALNRCKMAGCGYAFLTRNRELHLHQLHTATDPLVCLQCWMPAANEQVAVQHSLQRHHPSISSVVNHFRCPFNCRQVNHFESIVDLRRHINTEHKKDTTHFSDFCASHFHTEQAARSHDVGHRNGEEPRCCYLCGVGSPWTGIKLGPITLTHELVHGLRRVAMCRLCLQIVPPGDVKTKMVAHCMEQHGDIFRSFGATYRCGICNVIPADLKTHLAERHMVVVFQTRVIEVGRQKQLLIDSGPELATSLGLPEDPNPQRTVNREVTEL